VCVSVEKIAAADFLLVAVGAGFSGLSTPHGKFVMSERMKDHINAF
jgi:hypothetical protein